MDGEFKGAWFGDPKLRADTIALLRDDLEKDRYIKGTYLTRSFHEGEFEWKGCHIGCLAQAARLVASEVFSVPEHPHERVEKAFGIPREVARVWDALFEAQTQQDAPLFAVRSVEAVAPGADLRAVPHCLIWDLLMHDQWGIIAMGDADLVQRAAPVLAYFQQFRGEHMPGDPPPPDLDTMAAIALAERSSNDPTSARLCTASARLCTAYMAMRALTNCLGDGGENLSEVFEVMSGERVIWPGDTTVGPWETWAAERIIYHAANAPIVAAGP